MVSNSGGNGSDSTRGTGADKETQVEPEALEAGPDSFNQEPGGSAAPDAARGGCMRFGWGCLPILIGVVLAVPAGWLF